MTCETVCRELKAKGIERGSFVASQTDKQMKDKHGVNEIRVSGCVLQHVKARSAARQMTNAVRLDTFKSAPHDNVVINANTERKTGRPEKLLKPQQLPMPRSAGQGGCQSWL